MIADQRLSKLPAGAIGAALGAVLGTMLAEFDERSVSALAVGSLAGTVFGRIAPAVLVCGGAARGAAGAQCGAALAFVMAPVASFGVVAAARALPFP